jgi:hypothetical protein
MAIVTMVVAVRRDGGEGSDSGCAGCIGLAFDTGSGDGGDICRDDDQQQINGNGYKLQRAVLHALRQLAKPMTAVAMRIARE